MNARPDTTDSWWYRVLFTPVGPRLVVGRQWPGLPRRRPSAGALIDASDLPPALRDFIRALVSRTRLWRREKADVARELIAHFDDAQRREIDPDQALREFGDARQAAKLIRRAKKRRRPLVWQAWRRSLQAVGFACLIGIALYGLLIIRYYAGEPLVARNYTAELNSEILALPQDECGWPLYREALLALEAPLPSGPDGRSIRSPADDGWETMVEYLQRNQGVLELARRAASKPHLGIPLVPGEKELEDHWAFADTADSPWSSANAAANETPIGWGRTLGVSELRPLVRMLLADAQLSMLEEDSDRAQRDLFALIDLAQQCRESPLFIGDLYSLYVLHSASDVLAESLVHSSQCFDDDQLTGFAHRLSAYSGGGSIHVRFWMQRTCFEDLIQRLYTNDGQGNGRLTSEGIAMLLSVGPSVPLMGKGDEETRLEWLTGPLAAELIGSRREVKEEFERQLSLMERQAVEPMWTWTEVPGTSFENELESEAYRRRYLPLFVMLPAIGRAATQAEITTQRRVATLTAIAIELYRRRNGAYPETLNPLVPELLPTLPVDRFDGRPLRYRLTDDGPLLYSIGSDRIDDGGAPAETEYQRLHVPRYTWKIPNPPMQADWILWDGRRSHEESGD